MSGCSVLSQHNVPVNPVDPKIITIDQAKIENGDSSSVDDKGWWQIGFHRGVNEDDDIHWYYDTLLALKVFKPIIDSRKDIDLWRFHRRAADDKSAHKFSFIFYATRNVGEEIYQTINDDPVVTQMLSSKLIEWLSFYDINRELRASIENTSDRSWPKELQKTWPYFIMGASQTWLGLVAHYYGELALSDEANLDQQLEAFKQVSASIDRLWKQNGSHAFLHHLNALFAYQELYILEYRLGRF